MLMPGMEPNAIQQTFVRDSVEGVIKNAFEILGVSVVVDLDSLVDMEVTFYRNIAKKNKAKFHHIKMKTTMDQCIDRAQKDSKNYRVSEIVNSALRYGMYQTEIERPFYVVDITNKAAITEKVIKKMEEAAKDKQDIILISTEPESKRKEAEDFLREKRLFAMGLPINTLIMAEIGDKRSHKDIKEWIMRIYGLRRFTKKRGSPQAVGTPVQ